MLTVTGTRPMRERERERSSSLMTFLAMRSVWSNTYKNKKYKIVQNELHGERIILTEGKK